MAFVLQIYNEKLKWLGLIEATPRGYLLIEMGILFEQLSVNFHLMEFMCDIYIIIKFKCLGEYVAHYYMKIFIILIF